MLRAGGYVAVAVWGVVAGWWTPRGPASAIEALVSVGVSVAVGLFAGWASRSRWAMLLAPLVFATAVELVRIGVPGPTVDAPHASPIGVGALLLGRGVHGLFSLLPLVIGAGVGAGLWRRWPGRVAMGLLGVVQLTVAVAVVLPARTERIAGGIAELTSVTSGGHEFGLMLRGADPGAPVLLYVPGPPGGSEIGAMRRHLAELERHFVVATWDRRGGGKSYGALDPAATFTMDEEVRHALAVADHLRQRFGRDRIHLVGASGGSLVGVLAVLRRPEMFYSYVGVGQAINPREMDRRQYDDTLAWARRTGDTALERRLTELGPPPYAGLYQYEPLLMSEANAFAYDRTGNSEGVGGATENVGVSEYTLLEKVHCLSGIFDSFDILYPRYQDVDLRTQATRLAVPVYLVMGAHEVPARMDLARQWHALLEAPRKELVVIDGAGHRPQFERPAQFVDVLRRVLAESTT